MATEHPSSPAPGLPFRPFGSNGDQTTSIGLGGGALDKISLEEGVATVRRATELGVHFFDTSAAYCQGASQVIMAAGLRDRADPYLLATKLGYLSDPAAFRSVDALWAQLWECLRALRREHIDILHCHVGEFAYWWKDGDSMDALVEVGRPYDFDNAPIMQVLREAKDRGICRYIGITSDKAEQLAYILKHVDVDVTLLAYHYHLLDRRANHTVLPVARRKSLAYITAGILRPHLLTMANDWHKNPPSWLNGDMYPAAMKLCDIQRDCGLSMIELSVRFAVRHPDFSTVLVGAASPAEIEQCVHAAQQGPLPTDLHHAIKELAAL